MIPFEVLYGRRCKSPIGQEEIREKQILEFLYVTSRCEHSSIDWIEVADYA